MSSLHGLRGREGLRRDLARAWRAGTLPSGLLLHGHRGVGKQRLALWIAQLVLCETPGVAGPCDRCRACRLSLGLRHPDLHWYFPLPRPRGVAGDRLADALEDARSDALAEFRERPVRATLSEEPRGLYLAAAQSLRRRAHRRPSMAAVQVFIVAEAELLVPQESSPEAANALLKLLEEPPAGTRFILTSSEPGRLLPTIRSRTLPVHLPPLSLQEVTRFLEEEAGASPDDAMRAARLAQGSPGRGLGFLPVEGEPGPLERLRQEAFGLVRAAVAGTAADGFEAALGFPVAGARGLHDLFGAVEEWLRDLAAAASGAPDRILNQDAGDWLVRTAAAARLSAPDVARALDAVEEARLLAAGNVNPQLLVGGLLRDVRRVLRGRDRAVRAG